MKLLISNFFIPYFYSPKLYYSLMETVIYTACVIEDMTCPKFQAGCDYLERLKKNDRYFYKKCLLNRCFSNYTSCPNFP